MTIDYDSAFVQTGCYYDKWMRKLNYNNSDNTATMSTDLFDQGKTFRPYRIQMPADVFQAFVRLFDSLPELKATISAQEWIGSLKLGTNMVSNEIFAFYHATCRKAFLIDNFKSYWFHPFIRPLLEASFRATQAGQPIMNKQVDGREWVYLRSYPGSNVSDHQLGGIYTDFANEEFIPYTTLCAQNLTLLNP